MFDWLSNAFRCKKCDAYKLEVQTLTVLNSSLTEKYNKMNEVLIQRQAEIERLTHDTDAQALRQRISTLEQMRDELATEVKKLRKEPVSKEITDSLTKLREELIEAREALVLANRDKDEACKEYLLAQQELDSVKKKLDDCSSCERLRELKAKYDKLKDDSFELKCELEVSIREYKLLKEAYDKRGIELNEANATIKSQNDTIKAMDEERTMQANQIQKLTDDKRQLEEDKAELYHKCEDLQALLEKRTEALDVMEDMASKARISAGKTTVEDIEKDVEKRRKAVKAEVKKRSGVTKKKK